jgi:hypothetical protein
MSGVGRISYVAVCLAVASIACSAEEPAAVSPNRLSGVSDDSLICKAVTDRFVGIPEPDDGTTTSQPKAL